MFSFFRRLFSSYFYKETGEIFGDYVIYLDSAYKRLYAYDALSVQAKQYIDSQLSLTRDDPDAAERHADAAMEFVCTEIFGQMSTSIIHHLWEHRYDLLNTTKEDYNKLLQEGARLEVNFLDARNDYISQLVLDYAFSTESLEANPIATNDLFLLSNVVGEA